MTKLSSLGVEQTFLSLACIGAAASSLEQHKKNADLLRLSRFIRTWDRSESLCTSCNLTQAKHNPNIMLSILPQSTTLPSLRIDIMPLQRHPGKKYPAIILILEAR
mmetsp:Transcript_16299/g.34454  ORF Transcript_16299/g.34454 Transcript_16299/m.34454 type:complete len:106 (+) Transcript_16299:163-480(+)